MFKIIWVVIALIACNTFVYASAPRKGDEIEQTVKKLYSKDAAVRAQTRRQLCKIAQESDWDRNQVIFEVAQILRDPALIDSVNESGIWYDSAYLLGDLRAEEAIDTLVEHLDYHNGAKGFSLGHYPSAWALAEIGKPAVSRLKQALLWNPNSIVRQMAVRVLGKIGGEEAKEALQQALETETDEIVRFYIRRNLSK